MTAFLLVIGETECLREKALFPVVNWLFFETKSIVLKIDDFAILSLAHLSISPFWRESRITRSRSTTSVSASL
jgi:hypothetical protein